MPKDPSPSFFKDLVVPFRFPQNRVSAESHSDTLSKIEDGICDFLPLEIRIDNVPVGLCIIPFPYMTKFAEQMRTAPIRRLAA